jgi:hypothetical protein
MKSKGNKKKQIARGLRLLRRRQLQSDDHILSPRERQAFSSEERKLNSALRDSPHD